MRLSSLAWSAMSKSRTTHTPRNLLAHTLLDDGHRCSRSGGKCESTEEWRVGGVDTTKLGTTAKQKEKTVMYGKEQRKKTFVAFGEKKGQQHHQPPSGITAQSATQSSAEKMGNGEAEQPGS